MNNRAEKFWNLVVNSYDKIEGRLELIYNKMTAYFVVSKKNKKNSAANRYIALKFNAMIKWFDFFGFLFNDFMKYKL